MGGPATATTTAALAVLGHRRDEAPRYAEPLRHVKPVAEGGLGFRARFGVERDGDNLLAEGVYPVGSEIQDGYPEFTMQMLKKLGWDGDLTDEERAAIEASPGDKTNWKTDLSGGIQRVAIKHGCAPFGNAKARAVVWTFPDPVPIHREPLYTPRRDLVATSTRPTRTASSTACRRAMRRSRRGLLEGLPDHPHLGRLVEYEGGGDETRSNPWLAELQQDMFVEINPRDANNSACATAAMVWVEGPEGGKVKVMAMVTEAGRPRRGLHAVPLRRSLPGRGPAAKVPEGRRSLCARRGHQHRADLRLRLGHPDAGDQSHALPHRGLKDGMNNGTHEIPV
jgi:hypothetical protein